MKPIWMVGEEILTSSLAELVSQQQHPLVLKSLAELEAVDSQEDLPLAIVSVASYRAFDQELLIQATAKRLGLPYLRVQFYADRCQVGPWVLPGEPGCIHCAENRLKTVYPHKGLWEDIRTAQQQEAYVNAEKPWTSAFFDLVAAMVASEVLALHRAERLKLQQALYVAFDWMLAGQLHPFQPDPLCPVCSTLPADDKSRLQLTFVPRQKSHPRSYRLPNPHLTLPNLREKFLDWRTGIVFHLYREAFSNIVPMVGAEMPLHHRDNPEIGFGRTMNYEEAERTGILEALERYAGMTPRGQRTVVRGTYAQLQADAVHPSSFGLHDPKQYDEPGYRYVPYSDDLEVNWIWAYSWRQQKPVLVPEQLIYYQIQETLHRPTNRFCYETSNGCSMGGSLEEAIYYALLEVIERDAFLVSWYNRLPLQELQLDDVEDEQIRLVRVRFEALGYRLHVFDMTMDSGIPSIWALAIKRSDEGMKTYSAAGAHPDPEKAILGAIVEVVTSMQIYEHSLPQQRERAAEMVQDGSLVQQMHDHIILYSHPETASRFDFLFAPDRPRKAVKEVFHRWYTETPPSDLTEELNELVERILLHNQDVLIVEQTTPELEQIDVKAVKVLVPGMMTMSFGHQHRRIVPERVRNTPVRMGYRDTPITDAELNLYPHPFP